MNARVRHVLGTFGWWQWTLAAVFLVALLFAVAFAALTVRYTLYWSQHRDEPIERWMTVHYVAHSYRVPDEALWDALGLAPARPPQRAARRPLGEIAEEQGRSFDQVRATLQEAIARARTQPPPGAPQPPGTPGAPTPPTPRSDRGGP